MKRIGWIAAFALIAAVGVGVHYASGDAGSIVQDKARQMKCQNNLSQIKGALAAYHAKHGGNPSSLQALVDAKLIDAKFLTCPSGPGSGINYQYSAGAKGTDPLCRCGGAWHSGGRNVLKADGTIEFQK